MLNVTLVYMYPVWRKCCGQNIG